MRVKIKGTWYDSKTIPICIQVSNAERKQIENMDGPNNKYAVYPINYNGMTKEQMLEWMSEPDDIK